ncbi:hypothetical protein A2Y99_01885 [Candidatus Gottesmanbacteria bacterium RBG_13_37_7]|uniref:LysM domain-containing protein n=1 Tax=Candidatus Gottesmanbacteria bacterium RBG_13_37_7 TaxID=1798369 RepID=A0A1F5YJD2_9BACT|nr:MAG: hypothetical protein A2Y99_01885 [Candidatus Gottesmanbacteria bacterium RBG_13_37_7]
MVKESQKEPVKESSLTESFVSVTLGFLVVVVAGLLLYNRFSSKSGTNKTSTDTALNQFEEKTPDLPATHTIAKNENLWTIAEKYYGSGYNWMTIVEANKLKKPDLLVEGTTLNIPKAEIITVKEAQVSSIATERPASYTVVKGDSLWKIALKQYNNGYKWVDIAKANNLKNPDLIYSGNVLSLP